MDDKSVDNRRRPWRKIAKDEPYTLADLVGEKASLLGAFADGSSPRGFQEFVTARFQAPFSTSRARGPLYTAAFTLLSVLTIAAGLASSALAGAGNPDETAVAALGITVAVLTAINQLWRPAQRAVVRHQAANALRREGWDFVHSRGRYQQTNAEQQVGLFIDEIARIQRAMEAVDEAAPDASSGAI